MGELVNLRAARKRRERAAKEREAEENRARHGRTKADKQAEAAARERDAAALDGHRRPRLPLGPKAGDETP
ncbi:MAG TPA: DUF4169 family protein [Aquamicrobium sp.]|nr:DUF4169 family protein [Aquamicrobium sp.]